MTGSPVEVRAAKSGAVNSVPPVSGAPDTLPRPMTFSWSWRQPRLVGLRAGPDVVLQEGGLLGLDVPGAVLEPEQVAGGRLGRGGGGGPAEAELHPVVLHHAHAEPGQVSDRVEGDQGV